LLKPSTLRDAFDVTMLSVAVAGYVLASKLLFK